MYNHCIFEYNNGDKCNKKKMGDKYCYNHTRRNAIVYNTQLTIIRVNGKYLIVSN